MLRKRIMTNICTSTLSCQAETAQQLYALMWLCCVVAQDMCLQDHAEVKSSQWAV